MSHLICVADLAGQLDDPALRLVDARYDLADPDAGRARYAAGHIRGAVHLDLDRDLSRPAAAGTPGGRHPLPPLEAFVETLSAAGIDGAARVVVYDDRGGAFAGRLWWMLRYLGHEAVQLLDGGLPAWLAAGEPLSTEASAYPRAAFVARRQAARLASRDEVAELARGARPGARLVDARASARYRGEVEPLDLRAGHIPGALNRPFAGNLAEDGTFLAPAALRERYRDLAGADEVIVYCGSGVTACHDLLAIEEAGLPAGRLYLGSWSDWSSDPSAPLATGEG